MVFLPRTRDWACWILSVSRCSFLFVMSVGHPSSSIYETDNQVIEADYPTLLTQLLHYPAPSPIYSFDPSLIITQAIFLRGNVSPASGVQVVLQNQELLGIKAQPPERDRTDGPVRLRGQRAARGRPTYQGQAQNQQRGAGVQGFAQGWIDRAQAAGLDKAVYSAVSDLRVCLSILQNSRLQ